MLREIVEIDTDVGYLLLGIVQLSFQLSSLILPLSVGALRALADNFLDCDLRTVYRQRISALDHIIAKSIDRGFLRSVQEVLA